MFTSSVNGSDILPWMSIVPFNDALNVASAKKTSPFAMLTANSVKDFVSEFCI